jgi:DNA gyrase subunit A
MCTKNGTIKKTELSAFAHVRQSGIIAINLDNGDKLISAQITDGNCDVIIGTRNGLACRFRESDVRAMGRTAAGVRGISLMGDDLVISMIVIKRADAQVLVVSENGYGKRTRFEDFRLTKRSAKGVISMNLTTKTGKVVGLLPAIDSEDLVVMTVGGILIRQSIKQIRTIGRNTQGVRLIRLDDGDKIADIATVNRDDDEENTHDEIDFDNLQSEDGQESLL